MEEQIKLFEKCIVAIEVTFISKQVLCAKSILFNENLMKIKKDLDKI